jgi:acyl-coenzyme A synthetase/AMP-(fatty) acid ligase
MDLFQNLLEKYKPAYIISPSGWGDLEDDFKKIEEYRDYCLLQSKAPSDYSLNEELALLLTTSGSTGSPKLVRQSYKNINSNAASIVEYLGITGDDRAISTIPMNYTYGLSIINSHLMQGASIIMNDYTLMEKEFWALLKNMHATTFGGVPYIYEMLKKLRFERMNLPDLRYITQAGGRLPLELAEEFIAICARKGIKMIIMYGQTEATARMSYLPWGMAQDKPASIGIAIPGGKFSLMDDEGNTVDTPDTTGELIYTGENVTLGYAQTCDDLSKEDENHGILHTGDMAKRDVDGFYYIVGRKKRFLKLFGNRINLDELEAILNRKGYECVCSGIDDRLKIYVTDENI